MYYVSKSIWLSSSRAPGSLYLDGVDPHQMTPLDLTPRPTNTIWTVAKRASGSYSSITSSTTSTAFGTVIEPDETLSTVVGEGWVMGPYTGVFPLGSKSTMSLFINVDATTANVQQGLFQWKLWKASDVIASNPVLITSNITKTQIGVVTTGTGLVLSGSFPLTQSIIMNNEYLYVVGAWAITTAGSSNFTNIRLRAGSGSYLKTGPFEDNTVFIISGERTD